MIFEDKFTEKEDELKDDFDKLFRDILKNQSHPGDLMLLLQNCTYSPEILSFDASLSPYSIGPHKAGRSDATHTEFLRKYVNGVQLEDFNKYLEELKPENNTQERIEELIANEEFATQVEMLIYLKVWESDLFIKRLYQLVRLTQGQSYDWKFKIKESNRDNNATANRETIIRTLVRDKIETLYPSLYNSIKFTYRTQRRNSIAHSNYSIQNRQIHLNNDIANDIHMNELVVSFNDWVDIFHYTVIIHYLLHNSIIFRAHEHYKSVALKNPEKTVEVLIPSKDDNSNLLIAKVQYREEFNDWRYLEIAPRT